MVRNWHHYKAYMERVKAFYRFYIFILNRFMEPGIIIFPLRSNHLFPHNIHSKVIYLIKFEGKI